MMDEWFDRLKKLKDDFDWIYENYPDDDEEILLALSIIDNSLNYIFKLLKSKGDR